MNLQAALCILAVLCVNGLPTGTLSFSQNPNSTCLETHTAVKGDTCDTIASRNGLTVSELQTINARLGDICASIKPGQNYCVRELLWVGGEAICKCNRFCSRERDSSPGTDPVVQDIFQNVPPDPSPFGSVLFLSQDLPGERTSLSDPRNPRKLRKHQPECVDLSGILFLSIHGGRQIYKLRSPYSTRKRRKLRQKLGHVFLTPRKSP
ncbi:hypothetical protein PABG_11205 [Paracoccidioides brasiliensis Pb03]|nr:hypothetical protein PABG_11205 [Paracoccidioides brasiliensis Pb03]